MPAAADGQSDGTSSNRACSVIDAIQQIGSEWRLVVLHDLQEEEEKRVNEAKRSTGANSRTLSTRYRLSSEIAGSLVKGK